MTIKIDAAKHLCLVGAKQVRLTPKEFAVLHFLYKERRHYVDRTHLEFQFWGQFKENGRVDMCLNIAICRIRRKIGRPVIETIPRMGYRYIGS